MSGVCVRTPADAHNEETVLPERTETILPKKTFSRSLDITSTELSEAELDGEDVLFSTLGVWRECRVLIKVSSYCLVFNWRQSNGHYVDIMIRLDQTRNAWIETLRKWDHMWPEGIPSFVSYTPANECAPPYESSKVPQIGSKKARTIPRIWYSPSGFYRYEYGPPRLRGEAQHDLVEVEVEDEIGWVDPVFVYPAGRFSVQESETGLEFTLRRGADNSEVNIFLRTYGLGSDEFRPIVRAWHPNGTAVIYQENGCAKVPTALPSKFVVSKDELPTDSQGLVYEEGVHNGAQVFILSGRTKNECGCHLTVGSDSLTFAFQRTDWVQTLIHIPIEDKLLLKALRASVPRPWDFSAFGLIEKSSHEIVSKVEGTNEAATPHARKPHETANDSICCKSGTYIEGLVRGERYYIDQEQLLRRVHVQLKASQGKWMLEVRFDDGSLERIIPYPRSEKHFKDDGVISCWRSAFPDGATALLGIRQPYSKDIYKTVCMYFPDRHSRFR